MQVLAPPKESIIRTGNAATSIAVDRSLTAGTNAFGLVGVATSSCRELRAVQSLINGCRVKLGRPSTRQSATSLPSPRTAQYVTVTNYLGAPGAYWDTALTGVGSATPEPGA
jgi:hypothetical protein